MSRVNKVQSAQIGLRLRLYLAPFFDSKRITRTALANNLEISPSRVSAWLRCSRIPLPATAFDIGEALRMRGFATSGLEALYACGYFYDVLQIFKQLTHRSQESGTLAVFAYCALPLIHKALDERSLEITLLAAKANRNNFEETIRSASRTLYVIQLEQLLVAEPSTDHLGESLYEDLCYDVVQKIRTDSAISTITQAWRDVLADRSPSFHARRTGPIFTPSPEGIETIGAVIQRARQRRNVIPTLSAASLWRWASDWAAETEAEIACHFGKVLPEYFCPSYESGKFHPADRLEVLLGFEFSRESVERDWLDGRTTQVTTPVSPPRNASWITPTQSLTSKPGGSPVTEISSYARHRRTVGKSANRSNRS